MRKKITGQISLGFTLIELLVVIGIVGFVSTLVTLQFSKSPLEKARDDIRKTDINKIADAYNANAIGDSVYKPLSASGVTIGKTPMPPEGGSYQGLLTEDQEYFFVCASLEKGKDINCLLNSENPNCYCRKSKNAPDPIPSSTPTPIIISTSTPIGIGSTSPQPSLTPTPTPTPTPSSTITPAPSNPPSEYSDICPFQNVSQNKPATITMEGVDGSWCYDSDYMNNSTGGLVYAHTSGYCMDNNHNCADFCEENYPQDTVRDGYCTGTWWGAFWTNIHCEFGGYACTSIGEACNQGNSQAYCDPNTAPLPPPTPIPQENVAKRVFKTSTTYNGNLGGLTGADQKCQSRATAAGLSGIWKAWLSDGSESANSRLNHSSGPFILIDRTVVADNWTDLTDNTLDRNINMTEFGIIDSNFSTVWTGTDPSGNSTGKNCLNWTTALGWPYFGGIGSGNSTISYWTKGASDQSVCSSSYLSLYCFEQ